jgi:hypothetical protein
METTIAWTIRMRTKIARNRLARRTNFSARRVVASPTRSAATLTTIAATLQTRRAASMSPATLPSSLVTTVAVSRPPGNVTLKTIAVTVATKEVNTKTISH